MEELVPSEFYLSQNYPNPFKDKTTIKYCVADKTKIELVVYDSDRKKIKTLVNEIKEARTYKVEFNATGLPSGIYFYRLRAGSFAETKKMLLIK